MHSLDAAPQGVSHMSLPCTLGRGLTCMFLSIHADLRMRMLNLAMHAAQY